MSRQPGPKWSAAAPVRLRDRAVAIGDEDDVGGLLHERLEALLVLRRDAAERERVLDAPAPLAGEDDEQCGQRQDERDRGDARAAGDGGKHADGREQDVDDIDPAHGGELGADAHAQADP
jgi:hypothetical protein